MPACPTAPWYKPCRFQHTQFIDTGEKPGTKGNADHLLNPDAAEHTSYLQSYLPATNWDKINLVF